MTLRYFAIGVRGPGGPQAGEWMPPQVRSLFSPSPLQGNRVSQKEAIRPAPTCDCATGRCSLAGSFLPSSTLAGGNPVCFFVLTLSCCSHHRERGGAGTPKDSLSCVSPFPEFGSPPRAKLFVSLRLVTLALFCGETMERA